MTAQKLQILSNEQKAQAEIASSRKELANVSNKLAVQRGSSQKKIQKNKKILEAAMIDVLLSENTELSRLSIN